MIRRDYILRMIEEFFRVLIRVRGFKKSGRWDEAVQAVDLEFKRLVEGGAEALMRLTVTELFAQLIQGDRTASVRDRAFMLVTLLSEAAEIAATRGNLEQSREYYLKALHVVLETLAQSQTGEVPDFVPKVEMLVQALQPIELPASTQAMLMQHYERIGEFAKAEDALFALLEAESDRDRVVELGIAFYQRLMMQSDDALAAGNLPRREVEEGLAELQSGKR
jgi:hypothetical protein